MSSAPPPTVLSLKQSFLETQTRLLSQPLSSPSPAWHDHNASADHPLPPSAVDDAVFRLNQALQQHARRVYPPQSNRLIAEQIDNLCRPADANASQQQQQHGDEADEEVIPPLGADLTNGATIDALPRIWPSGRDRTAQPMEAARYKELAERLSDVGKKRAEALDRMQRLRAIRKSLEPFVGSGPEAEGRADADKAEGEGEDEVDGGDPEQRVRNNVQKNLLARDGEIEKEMQRMRMLLARVGGRVGALPRGADAAGGDDVVMVDSPAAAERRKVDGLMDLF